MITRAQILMGRKGLGLRQSDLAAKLHQNGKRGINPGRVSEWENGRKPIPEEIEAQLQVLFAKRYSH